MNIAKKFDKKNTVVSFEIFPPKAVYPIDTVYETIDALGDLSPDYISVTYGAGGSVKENRTCELAAYIKTKLKIEPLAHLTCIGSTRAEIDKILCQLKEARIENVLALRGDRPKSGECCEGDFKYAADLIEYIKSHGDFNVSAACYPEKHPECDSFIADINNLKNKVDCGAEHLITQLFFDNNKFYSFMDAVIKKGINVPVSVGIMPIINKKQIEKMAGMCGASIPKKHINMLNKFGDNPLTMREAGIVFALEQIVDLIANGVRGIHIYTMNNPYVARRIMLYLSNIFDN